MTEGGFLVEWENMNSKTGTLIGIVIVLILGGLMLFWSLFPPVHIDRNPDVSLSASISQIRIIADTLYDKEKTYLSLGCDYNEEMKTICSGIFRIVGTEPTIHKSEKAYCVYTKLTKGGYFCIDSNGFREKTTINPGQENYCDGKTFSCTVEKTEDETADWKTYRNEDYGFEIKYPLDWSTYPDWDRKGISFVSGQVSFSPFTELELGKGDGAGFYVSVLSSSDVSTSIGWINPSEITARELIEKEREIFKDDYSGAEFEITDENLNGLPVVKEEINKLIMDGKEGSTVAYYIDSGSRKFIIGYSGSIQEMNKNIATFNQMLSTFRFLEKEMINNFQECIVERNRIGWLDSKTTSLCECDLPDGRKFVKEIENIEDLVTKYTDEEFGFSFYYPKSLELSKQNPSTGIAGLYLLKVGPFEDTISISKTSGDRFEQFDAKFGPIAYYYDKDNSQWIRDKDDIVFPAEPSFYTISELPVFRGTVRWATNIVVLSINKFLSINITGSGWSKIVDPLTKTVVKKDQEVSEGKLKDSLKEEICSLER
jgi:hypothetical protein